MSGSASDEAVGVEVGGHAADRLGPLSSSVASCTSTRPSVTRDLRARALRSSRSVTLKRAGNGPAERTATQLPATPSADEVDVRVGAWSRARKSLSWTTTSPGGIAGERRRARRRRGGVHRRGLARRVRRAAAAAALRPSAWRRGGTGAPARRRSRRWRCSTA